MILLAKIKGHIWKEKKLLTRNPTLEFLALKNEAGQRVTCPTEMIRTTADYFRNLYTTKSFPYHPYHQIIEHDMKMYDANRDYEETRYNREPTVEELIRIIEEKKNGKSTPDVKNEILKKPGIYMIEFL